MGRRSNRRRLRNYAIKKDVQLKLISINLIHLLFAALISIAITFSPIISLMYVPGSLDLQYQAAQFFMIILERLPFALFLLLALIFVHQMLIAHRFCGPIINFSHTIRRVTRGDLTRTVRLRRYDFFKEEERYLNDMLHELSHRIGSIKKDHENLARALEDITIQAADSPQAQRSVQALKTALEHSRGMEEHLSVFRLPGEGGGRPRTDLKEAVGDRMVSGRKGQIPPAGTKALGAKAPNAA